MKKGRIFSPEKEIKELKWFKSKKGSPGVWIKDMLTGKENNQVTVRFVRVEISGQIIPHTHDVMEVFYILEGEGEVIMGKDKKICKSGTCLIAPAGVKHSLKNIRDIPVLLLCVFTPPLKG